MKEYLISILCFLFSGLIYGQEGIHIGLNIGPDKTIIQREANPIYPPNSNFKGALAVAEAITLDYGITDNISVKLNLRNASYGFRTSFTLLNQTTGGNVFNDGRSELWQFSYLHYEIALGLRIPLITNRLFLFENTGIVYYPTGNSYFPEEYGGLYLNGIDKLLYKSTIYSLNKKHNWGVSAALGFEVLFLRKNFISLSLYEYQGFKTVTYLVGQTNLNGQNYTNTIVSNGSYLAIQLGYKRAIKFRKRGKEDNNIEMEDEERNGSFIDERKNDQIQEGNFSDFDYLFKKGNKLFGGSLRLVDMDGPYLPISGVGLMPRFLYFIKNNIAIGPTFYGKYFKYGSTDHHELMGGLATRYYLGKSRNRIFGALDFVAGSYKDIYTEFIPAVVPGIGYNRVLGKSTSLETSVKYMYLINSQNTNNLFLDIGINYHF